MVDLEKMRELHVGSTIGDWCRLCKNKWPCPTIQLADELQDIRDGEQTILAEKCASDEVHCGCVPVLRMELKLSDSVVNRQIDVNQGLREALELIRDEPVSNLSVCFRLKDIAHAALEEKP
jgi:hypothetical protein